MRNLRHIIRHHLLNESNIGYHYGDLGKSHTDTFEGMRNNRSTGFYGYGTYFLGSKLPQYELGEYTSRPMHIHSFDGYNLFRPQNYRDGLLLHDNLKIINDTILEMALHPFKPLSNEQIQFYEHILDMIYDLEYDDYLHTQAMADKQVDYMMFGTKYEEDEPTEKEIQQYIQQSAHIINSSGLLLIAPNTNTITLENALSLANQISNLKDHFEEIVSKNKGYYAGQKELKDSLKQLSRILNKSIDDIDTAYQKCLNVKNGLDSIPTIFMKSLGFDGIDVRGIDGLDNTKYGSVIYDL